MPLYSQYLHGMHNQKAGGELCGLWVSILIWLFGVYLRHYSKKVTSTYGLFSKKKDEFRWIPGLRKCPLGHPGMTTPCEKPQCPLCNVLRGTYDPEIHGKGISTMSLPR